jgi:hypothetical protein
MKRKEGWVIIVLFILALGSVILFFPGVRYFIISRAESVLDKTLFRDFWFLFLRNMAITGLFIVAAGSFAFLTKTGKALCIECRDAWKQEFRSFAHKRYVIWFLILTAIYLLGILTIIRANFSYNDDLDRALKGYRGWSVWGRYIADFLSTILHMNLRLTDISPLPQILAVLILAASTLAFLKALSQDNITVSALVAAIPIGLSPYFLENYSFKFDAPYMALSVFFSIIPFLFYRKTAVFCITSFFCLIAMCMSYQAASGIYIVMVLIIACRLWISGETPVKNILTFITASMISYLTALIFFKTALFVSMPDGSASTIALSLNRLFPGIVSNSITYVRTIIGDFRGNLLVVLLPLSILLFIIINVFSSKRNRALTFAVMLIGVPVMLVLSYGAYLALQNPLWLPRAFIGFGVFTAAILTCTVTMPAANKALKFCSIAAALLVSYNFLVIDLAYGNALAEQKQYQNFRTALLIADINRNLDNSLVEPVIRIENNIGYSPVIDNISKTCPLVKRLVYIALSGGNEWGHLPLHYYRFNHAADYEYANDNSFSVLPVLVDNHYHTIRGDGKYFFITLK